MRTENISVDTDEIEHFAKDSSHWWDENGPFAPLHRMNPVRISYIRDQITGHYSLDTKAVTKPLSGLNILDIGCGGGLVCEPLARLGGTVSGLDADDNAVTVATAHAKENGLGITYHAGAAEALPPEYKESFDVVLALEIVEHVQDVPSFIETVSGLCKPGGLVIFSTLNRTPKSFALGIVAAEHILRWVPQGTHKWKKFIRPSEMARHLRYAGNTPVSVKGIIYDPIKSEFSLSDRDIDVNYFITAIKKED